jgi:hypothetical protein
MARSLVAGLDAPNTVHLRLDRTFPERSHDTPGIGPKASSYHPSLLVKAAEDAAA